MKKLLPLFLLTIFFTVGISAQTKRPVKPAGKPNLTPIDVGNEPPTVAEEIKTGDGRIVLLMSNNTWAYGNPPPTAAKATPKTGVLSLEPVPARQSGTGALKGFVASGIKNNSGIDATIQLRAIENNAGTKSVSTVRAKGGYYETEVSFGYYDLTISADGYETYRTKVYIPSSSTLEWGTILEKSERKTNAPRENGN